MANRADTQGLSPFTFRWVFPIDSFDFAQRPHSKTRGALGLVRTKLPISYERGRKYQVKLGRSLASALLMSAEVQRIKAVRAERSLRQQAKSKHRVVEPLRLRRFAPTLWANGRGRLNFGANQLPNPAIRRARRSRKNKDLQFLFLERCRLVQRIPVQARLGALPTRCAGTYNL